jgi:hypothetical protein
LADYRRQTKPRVVIAAAFAERLAKTKVSQNKSACEEASNTSAGRQNYWEEKFGDDTQHQERKEH